MTDNVQTDTRIVLDGVSKSYYSGGTEVKAVSPVSLTFEPGEFISVVGPSGCGKTTLLQILAGFLEPTSGTATLGEKPIEGPDPNRGVVFQQPNLYPWLNVRKNVELPLKLRGVPKKERRAQAEQYLELVGLTGFGDRRPYELSGGMQQRCQIARVLINDPDVILMDEPFGALDAMTRERLQLELLDLWRARNKTVFFITHSVDEAIFLGTRVLVMSSRPGSVIFDEPAVFGPPENRPDGKVIRSLPAFVALRDRVAAKIYETQGASGAEIVLH